MSKHIVCLTFDFDAISGFIARGQTTATWLSRGEFGARVGAPRLLALFRKYGIPTSWYVPGHTIETFPSAMKSVVEAGHEIGHHGWTHRPPAGLTREQEEAELVRGNEAIRRISGRTARGYRSPSWDLSPHSVELMINYGFDYDSSMMGSDYTPYFTRQHDRIGRHHGDVRAWQPAHRWTHDQGDEARHQACGLRQRGHSVGDGACHGCEDG